MMVVTAVVVLLIGLLLPALSGARDTALKTSTSALQNDVTAATARFSNDNGGRLPGLFSARVMGSDANEMIGMTAMENALLELGGNRVVVSPADDADAPDLSPEAGIIEVGPTADAAGRVVVNVNQIGGDGAYFSPDAAFLQALSHQEDGEGFQAGTPADASGQGFMPDVIDAWGNPLLVWAQDDSARGSIVVSESATAQDVYTQFVRLTSDGPGDPGDLDGPAWFYLMSNRGFLESQRFGDASRSMSRSSGLGSELLDGTAADELDRLQTLAALLASPSSFQLDPGVADLATADPSEIFPSRPRARFMVHSAGSDGIYFSRTGDGWNANSVAGQDYVDFGNTFKNQIDERYVDRDGSLTNIDLLDAFDDQISSAK